MKRVHSPEDDLADHTPKKITKRMKPESVKVSKESLREGTQIFLIYSTHSLLTLFCYTLCPTHSFIYHMHP